MVFDKHAEKPGGHFFFKKRKIDKVQKVVKLAQINQ